MKNGEVIGFDSNEEHMNHHGYSRYAKTKKGKQELKDLGFSTQ